LFIIILKHAHRAWHAKNGISGHERVSGFAQDRFKFRTPTLRNVALTPPYGHDGAFDTLRGVIEHHLDSVDSLYNYSFEQAVMPSRADLDLIDQYVMSDPVLVEDIAKASELPPVRLSSSEIDQLIAFLHALTDPAALDLRRAVPKALPSGLPLHD